MRICQMKRWDKHCSGCTNTQVLHEEAIGSIEDHVDQEDDSITMWSPPPAGKYEEESEIQYRGVYLNWVRRWSETETILVVKSHSPRKRATIAVTAAIEEAPDASKYVRECPSGCA